MPFETIWIFTSNNCRKILADPADFMDRPDAYIKPDRSKVRGYAPHFYLPPADRKKIGGVFELMNADERADRMAHHTAHGVDNDICGAPVLTSGLPVVPSGEFRIRDILNFIGQWIRDAFVRLFSRRVRK